MAKIPTFYEYLEEEDKNNKNKTVNTEPTISIPSYMDYTNNQKYYDDLYENNKDKYKTLNTSYSTTQERTKSDREEELNSGFNDYLYRLNHPIYALTKLPETAQKAVEAGKNFFSQSFFKQGEGNVLQNIGGTLADTGINVSKGLLNYAEDIADFGVYKIADLAELVGQNDKAASMRKHADVRAVNALFGENELNTENINFKYLPEAVMTGKIENEVVPDETLAQKIDKYSYFDRGMDDVAQGVGQLLGTIGTTELIGKTGLTKGFENTLTKHGVKATVAQDYAKSLNTALSSYASAYGGTYESVRRAGYGDDEARKQARISGLVEAISEQLHDGIPGTKTAGWADKIVKINNPTLKVLYNSLGEVDEEVFGEILSTIINDVRFNLDPDNPYLQDINLYSGDILKDIYNNTLSDDAKGEYLTVFLSTLITNGMSEVNTSLERRKNANQNPLLKTENLNQGQPIEQVKSQHETKIEQKVQNVPQVMEEKETNEDELYDSNSYRRRTMKEIQSLVSKEEYNDLLKTIGERDMSDEELGRLLDEIKGIDTEEKKALEEIDSDSYRRTTMKEIQDIVTKKEYDNLLQEIGEKDMSDEQLGEYLKNAKQKKKKQLLDKAKKIRADIAENYKGPGLTTEQAKEYMKKGKKEADIWYELETKYLKKLTPEQLSERMKKNNSKVNQDPEILIQARQDMLKNKNGYDAISEANRGTFIDSNTAVDDIVEGKNKNISFDELYDQFSDTRKMLKEKYGKTMPLYRVETQQKSKPTKNYGDSEEYIKNFGDDVKKYDIDIDDILGVHIDRNGFNEEYIVLQDKYKKSTAAQKAKPTTQPAKQVKQEQPKTNPLIKQAKTVQEETVQKQPKKTTEDNIVETQEEYKSTDKLPETVKKGTYIEPTTPIKQDTKKGQKFVKQITNQNVLKKELSKNYTSFVDKLHPVQELADVSGNDQVYPKFNNRGMSNGKGQYQIGTAQTDNNGNKIGKSVNEIFKPAEDSKLTTEFDDYLAHRLNIERYDKVPVWDESVTPEISQEIVDEYEEKYPQFKEWAKDVYTFNDNQLQKMIDAGLSKENARDWLYDNYVTISRQIGPTTNPLLVNAKGVKVNSPIRKAKGSNLEMRPMKEAMARQTLLVERSIADNIAGQELLNILGGTVGDTKSLLTQDMEGNNNALTQNSDGTYNYTVYKNGVPVTMQVTKELADAIRPTKEREWESLLPFKAVRKMSEFQRGILTDKNPLFIFTNFFKDIGDAPLNSKYSAGELYANYPKNVYKMLTNSPEWQQYVANGGLANTYFNTKEGVFEKSSNKFVRGIQTINQLVEQAPRFTEYLNTLAHGGTIQEALYNAAEITTNFARGGEITKVLNRNGFNFLNASVQGFDKQIRNFTRQPGAKAYVRLLSKVAVLGVLPALINHALLGDDDDYEELPNYVKDNYYLFKTSDNNFIRIPKGRVMSIFGTAARHTVEVGKGNETVGDLASDTKEQIINNVAPNNPLENNIFSPLISVANNKSWNGSKIVSTTLENYPDAYQYDEKTTSIAKWLGKTFNLSPKKIDYLLDQYTGGIGDVIMPMTTPYAETKSDNIIENAIVAPFKSKFTVDSTISNKYVNEYYDTKNELQKKLKTYSSIEESSESYIEALQYKYLDTVGNEISKLYNEKRQIQNSNLSNAEKYEQARAIQRQIDDLAKFAMQDYNTGYYTDDYAIVGDKEFITKVTNGKMNWTAVDSDTKKKQMEYAEKYDMSPEEYYSMEGLTGSTIAGSNIYDFKEMNKKLTDIRNNTTNDKEETFKYINSLDLSIPQKAMYLRKYYKSFNDYNEEIFNYVNSLNIIPEQKKAILIYLGFDYDKNTKTFSW